MRMVRTLVAVAVPAAIALVALLNARAVGALVAATVDAKMVLPQVGEARAMVPFGSRPLRGPSPLAPARPRPAADAILDRNPFDHSTGPLRAREPVPGGEGDGPRRVTTCEGVRPLVLVSADDPEVAFAALDVGGRRVLRKRGGEVLGMRLAYVGRDRVWFEMADGFCQALLFGAFGAGPIPPPAPATPTPLEVDVASKIVKTGPNEYAIDRAAVDRILDAQAEMMKARVVPEKEGDRVVGVKVFGVKPGSVLSMLGIENGDRLETINGFEVSSPEKMLEAYARLRAGADRLSVHLTRAGRAVNLDYTVR
jgi:general secretion pathway protein C